MAKRDTKEIDAAFDSSLKRAKSTYNWVTGAKDALDKKIKQENKAPVKITKVKYTKVDNTKVVSTKIDGVKLRLQGYYVVPNKMDDVLSKLLQPSQEIIYRKLYRWSWGYNRNYCQTSYSVLSKKTNLKSTKTIRDAINGLTEKGLIERFDENSLTNPKGSTYLVHIPQFGDDNELLFVDVDAPTNNTKVNSTKVATTKVGSVINTKLNSTKANAPDSKIPIQSQTKRLPTKTPLKNTIVESTNQDKNINTNSKKHTLSPHALVQKFYFLLNQTKVSRQKTERALGQINQLGQEGFSLKDIDFAIEWTVQNKSGLHSFGIVAETIGEALAEKQKYLEIHQKKERIQKEKEKEQRERKKKRDLERKIQDIRDTLSQGELAIIHQEAESTVIDQIRTKKFGRDILVRLKEDEIIRNLYLNNP